MSIDSVAKDRLGRDLPDSGIDLEKVSLIPVEERRFERPIIDTSRDSFVGNEEFSELCDYPIDRNLGNRDSGIDSITYPTRSSMIKRGVCAATVIVGSFGLLYAAARAYEHFFK